MAGKFVGVTVCEEYPQHFRYAVLLFVTSPH